MSKRKRETADEASATPEQPKKVKKQKTRASQAKDPWTAAPDPTGAEESAQGALDRRNKKLARKLAKRGKATLEKPQRDESGREDGTNTGKDNDDAGLLEVREKKLVEKGQTATSSNRHESREREKESGQKLAEKHKPKEEKRRDRIVRSNGKESKKKAVESATWKVSEPVGGQMLDVDPVFSPDEK